MSNFMQNNWVRKIITMIGLRSQLQPVLTNQFLIDLSLIVSERVGNCG